MFCCEEGHSFEPRYTFLPPTKIDTGDVDDIYLEDVIDKLTAKHYICDICVKCGQISQPQNVGGNNGSSSM